MGGNFGSNTTAAALLPEDHFRYLQRQSVNWLGVHIEVHVDDSMDSKPRPRYSGIDTPAFRDDVLIGIIRAAHAHGLSVFLSYGMSDAPNAEHPARGWQLGDPTAPEYDATIDPDYWPWALAHPRHASFVRAFWNNWTKWAVYYAKIAQKEGVELYGLGGENTGLFRTRTGDTWPNEFRSELETLVRHVRRVYEGPLTYEMHGERFREQPDSSPVKFWTDLDLDVVGMTAHFRLLDEAPTRVSSVAKLKRAWKNIYRSTLIPLRQQIPDKPIVFVGGYGITDSVRGPYQHDAQEGDLFVLDDGDGNGVDDGQETQSNFHTALYQVMKRNPGVVQGGLLWGEMMASDAQWANSFALDRGIHVRSKPSERIVRRWFRRWRKRPPAVSCR